MDGKPIRQGSQETVMGRDDFDAWFDEEERRDPRLREALEDAACRSSLLTRLIDCRLEAHLTQSEVAQSMETTQSAVSELEGGATDPRLSTLQRYARAVGCHVSVHVHARGIVPTGFHGWQRMPVPVVAMPSFSLPAASASPAFAVTTPVVEPDAYSAA